MTALPVDLHYYRGRVALSAILRGLGLSRGDEVVVQAYTCVAVLSALVHLGLRPAYADIDRRSLTMDPERLADAVSERTRAVVVQHTFGVPADVPGMLKITEQVGASLVEDCAHVLGTRLARQPVGKRGVAAFLSYEWGKPVVAGVGGAAIVNDPGLAQRMLAQYESFAAPPLRREVTMSLQYLGYRAATRTGLFWRARGLYRALSRARMLVGSYDADPCDNPEYGWRMSWSVRRRLQHREASAYDELNHRRSIATRYVTGLQALGFPVPALPEDTDAVLMRIPVPVAEKQRVLAAARNSGLEVGDWFATPVHPLAGEALEAVGYHQGMCPNAEWAARHIVTLPVRGDTREENVDRTLDLLSRFGGPDA